MVLHLLAGATAQRGYTASWITFAVSSTTLESSKTSTDTPLISPG